METQNQYPDIPEFIAKMAKAAAGSMRSRGLSVAEDQSDQEQNILLHILLKTGNMQDLRNLSEADVRALIASFMKSKKREIARQQTDLERREALIAEIFGASKPFEPNAVMRLDINRASGSLSRQQKRIVNMLYRGMRRRDIAEEMDITPAAVHFHIGRIKKTWKQEGLGSYLQTRGEVK